jgi:hypothetical protein
MCPPLKGLWLAYSIVNRGSMISTRLMDLMEVSVYHQVSRCNFGNMAF